MSAITEGFSGDGCDGVGDNRISAAGDKGVGRGIDDGIAVFAAIVMSVLGIDGHGGQPMTAVESAGADIGDRVGDMDSSEGFATSEGIVGNGSDCVRD